jgi:hypothetical protein
MAKRLTGRHTTIQSKEERDRADGITACRAFFGCENGGRDFDEFDQTEALHALTPSERDEAKLWLGLFSHVQTEDEFEKLITKETRQALTKEQKKRKNLRYKNNKRARR